jgi:hypothetical protein
MVCVMNSTLFLDTMYCGRLIVIFLRKELSLFSGYEKVEKFIFYCKKGG